MDQPEEGAQLRDNCASAPLAPICELTQLRAEFERCWPWLWSSLCEFGPTHHKEQVWLRLVRSQAFLWSTRYCVIVGEFILYPIGLRAFNYWLQGGSLAELKTLHDGIEAWAKERGAQQARGEGRQGWLRAMTGEWEKGATVRTKWLIRPPSSSNVT
jgi:hypothetical protein